MVLVDSSGRTVGSADLVEAHRAPGLKHRAFTLIVVDENDHLVLARRSAEKPLWPLHFDGTVASHPVAGESNTDAARRRAREELGATLTTHEVGLVDYRVDDPNSANSLLGPLAEHERCAVLVARIDATTELRPNPSEVESIRRVSLASLLGASAEVWSKHCPWLPLALEVVRSSSSFVPRAFERAFAPLALPGAEAQLAAAIRDLVPGGTWNVE